MGNYINITLDLSPIVNYQFDLRIPSSMTLKEMLQIISDAYQMGLCIKNPSARVVQSGEVLLSTNTLADLKDGMLIKIEMI